MTVPKRRILVVDRKWQFHIWRLTAGASISTGILYLACGFAFITLFPIEELSAEALGLLAFGVNALFFLAMALVMLVVTMRFTNAVAGPAMVLKRAIEGLRKGEYHHRCKLRENDYLQDLATAVQDLQDQMRGTAESQKPAVPVVTGMQGCVAPPVPPAPALESAGHGQRGFTLLESMVALLIVVIGVQGVLLTAHHSSKLQQGTSDHVKAQNACRDFLERFRNGDLTAQFQAYAGSAPFQVGDQTVTVTFPQSVLTQALGTVPATARFRDLNNDGQVDLDTASTEVAGLLPVQITVRRSSFRMQMACLMTER